MPQKKMKCGWKYCKHEPTELSVGSGVRIGNRWYHEDCAKKRNAMIEIRDYYYEHVDKTVVMKQLVNVIKKIIVDKEVDPDFALFALKYAVKNNLIIRSPYILHYFVTDFKIKEAYNRYLARLKTNEKRNDGCCSDIQATDESVVFEPTERGFGSIFKDGGNGF